MITLISMNTKHIDIYKHILSQILISPWLNLDRIKKYNINELCGLVIKVFTPVYLLSLEMAAKYWKVILKWFCVCLKYVLKVSIPVDPEFRQSLSLWSGFVWPKHNYLQLKNIQSICNKLKQTTMQ